MLESASLLRQILREAPFRSVCKIVARLGLTSWKTAVDFDALPYASYAVGLQIAARYAEMFGVEEFSAIECGVAGGTGLMTLATHAKHIPQCTQIVGFDSGTGLPPPHDWRDMPWMCQSGDFPCDVDALRHRLNGSAELVLGDISDTFPAWIRGQHLPVGFISIDTDYYSSAVSILKVLATCDVSQMLPIVSMYCDDVCIFSTPRCVGELAAIADFNSSNLPRRFIDRCEWLPPDRAFKDAYWLRRMFDLYSFEHPAMRHPAKLPSNWAIRVAP
ncbi:MAG TPA: hypothetical protein VMQ17_07875 [Candidatus Sulfotelmatobacter sp.]|nr:hypothetical protein [Candidatus Sulfotelmatobacter sp.]